MKSGARTASLLVFAAVWAPVQASAGAQDDLLAADKAWETAYSAKDLGKSVAAVDTRASLLWPNAPVVAGKEAITRAIQEDFSQGDLSWRATSAGVARSGELGYTSGSYESASGGAVTDDGKYLTIWKKEPDGWKVLFDTFNTSRPAAAK